MAPDSPYAMPKADLEWEVALAHPPAVPMPAILARGGSPVIDAIRCGLESAVHQRAQAFKVAAAARLVLQKARDEVGGVSNAYTQKARETAVAAQERFEFLDRKVLAECGRVNRFDPAKIEEADRRFAALDVPAFFAALEPDYARVEAIGRELGQIVGRLLAAVTKATLEASECRQLAEQLGIDRRFHVPDKADVLYAMARRFGKGVIKAGAKLYDLAHAFGVWGYR